MDDNLKRLWFSFEGRASRSDYWLRVFLPILGISIVLGIIDAIIGAAILGTLFTLFSIWPSLAISVKRLHDRDMTGWWLLLYLLPVIGWLILFVIIGFLKGTDGENQYGSDPLEAMASMD